MSYFDTLYSASYNGAPFFVRQQEGRFGRKIVTHNYPNRDSVYNEDLGRKPREFEIEGYIVGDDVTSQLNWILTVCEQPGIGVLIHPSLGVQSVNLMGLTTSESFDHGRQIVLKFKFMESGQSLFPTLITSTFNIVGSAVGNLNSAASSDFLSTVGGAVALGSSVVTKGAIVASTFTALGGSLVKSASNLSGITKSLVGSFGRYSGGNTGSTSSSVLGGIGSLTGISSQVSALIGGGVSARANVTQAGASVNSAAAGM